MDYWDFRGGRAPRGGGGKGGPRNCTRGKSCGATCISQDKYCWVNLPGGKPGSNGGKNLHDSVTKVRDMVQSRRTGSQKTSVPQTPSTPTSRTDAQREASLAKQQRKKDQENKSLQGAKDRASQSLQPQPKKLSESSIRAKERQEANGDAQKVMNQRQDATKLSEIQTKAVKAYTSDREIRGVNQYQNVNNCLRNPAACVNEPEAKALQKGLDSALATLPKNTENFQFTRVIPVGKDTSQLYDFLKSAKPGTLLKDPGYASFTSDKEHAAALASPKWGKSISMVTRSGQIVPVNQFSSVKDELEGLLPRGASLKIANVVEDKNGSLVVYLDD